MVGREGSIATSRRTGTLDGTCGKRHTDSDRMRGEDAGVSRDAETSLRSGFTIDAFGAEPIIT